MQADKLVLVTPYQFGETCAMACGLIGLLDSLPFRLTVVCPESAEIADREIHFRYDRRVIFADVDEFLRLPVWQGAAGAIWFSPSALCHYANSPSGRPRKHWLIMTDEPDEQTLEALESLPGDVALVLVRLRVEQSPNRTVSHRIREFRLPWDSALPLHTRCPGSRWRLLVLAGLSPEDVWIRRHQRLGVQLLGWLEAVRDLECRIVSAVPNEDFRGWCDMTLPVLRQVRDAYPARVQVELRPANFLLRTQLYQQADVCWNLSPHPSGLWDLEAGASGCAVMTGGEPQKKLLPRMLRPYCRSLPATEDWLCGSMEEGDEQALEAILALRREWSRGSCEWNRVWLERQRRNFQMFWRQQLGLETSGEALWTSEGVWKLLAELLD